MRDLFAQRVLSPVDVVESWTVLDDDRAPVAPIERYLAYSTQIERYLAYLTQIERSPNTVNRKLSALSAFYQHAARHGVDLGELLRTWQLAARRRSGLGLEAVLAPHISKGYSQPRRAIALSAERKLPRVLTATEAQAILDACDHLRDRFLFAVLFDTGIRIGEALGLRHEDIAAAESQITVQRRVNDNVARSKSRSPRTVPVSTELVRLYADYLHLEYGDLDSDYVFVNVWGRPHGHPLTYTAVYDLVKRLRRRTGIDFDPHWYRHTAATRMLRDGVPNRGGLQAARPCRHHHHCRRLRAPERRGRPQGAGGSGMVHRPRGTTVSAPSPLLPGQPSRTGRDRRRTSRQSSGWDVEYGKDVWRLRELGIKDRRLARITFEEIPKSWLKASAKRWARWRLATGLGVVSVSSGTRAITFFGQFLADVAPSVLVLADVDREVLERYLAHLHARFVGIVKHRMLIGQLNLFFTLCGSTAGTTPSSRR